MGRMVGIDQLVRPSPGVRTLSLLRTLGVVSTVQNTLGHHEKMDSPSSTIINSVHTALVEGDGLRPLAALTVVAIATVVPLTFVRKLWSMSVGYERPSRLNHSC